MKKNFAEKSLDKAFLGMFATISAASFMFTGCNQKQEIKTSENNILKEHPVAPLVSEINDKNIISDRRVIYLTFDDGPNRGTENLLKILHKRNVCATAFLVGQHATGSQKQKDDLELLRKDSLIELANHSYTHAHNKYTDFYKNSAIVIHDFDTAIDSLKLKNKIARTPGRNIWRLNNITSTDIKTSNEAANNLYSAGYKIIGWDLEWKPTNKMGLKGNHQIMLKKVDSIFFNDLEKTSRHLVFLTHDQYLTDEDSVNELELFIEKLQKTNRFVFRKISEYPRINEVLN
ncbi:polysaccharide deacetylase family protein [Chryseobacterium chendengshani]|uniref:polysaccharide deacetylase family protein n=1 Tax=Chryseobacterium sp. LJ668 TaxID=2864040 RepID=UPI001C68F074|nr:polysaccharide deacetylase family protein [Chryseobacterium sp. LJ668]MBW8522790.1 polysaccharide deacetylase family protein [Chryseobacterium sp. LJ668]QYK16322.1 polysaccharide deacetylase family protein [Chryseobacterium sp. LJ668]